MKSFDKEISQFLIDSAFNNNLDDAGNINLFTEPVDINQKFIAFQLKNYLYDNSKIESLYDVKIKDFTIPVFSPLPENNNVADVSTLAQENEILKNQLNAIISADNQNSASAVVNASRDVIIKLRIQLKEGTVPEDFSNDFPYLKI